jgi:hypothetical protein
MSRHPLLVGLQAARANFLPGLVIQTTLLALLLGYYYWPPLQTPLNLVAHWKAEWSYLFSFSASALGGGFVPELLRVVVLQKGKVGRENLLAARFGFFFWGSMGICGDAFYRLQGVWFGTTPSVCVVITKMAVDQFIYTPIWGTAAVVSAYYWRRHGYTLSALGDCFSTRFYRIHILPTLITGWAMWIPLVSIVYSLPPLLQVPFATLATSFWSLLVTFIGSQAKLPEEPSSSPVEVRL